MQGLARQKRTERGRLGAWGVLGAIAGGLAAGAGAAHLLYRHGHRYGLELRPPRPEPLPPRAPTPEDFEATFGPIERIQGQWYAYLREKISSIPPPDALQASGR